MKLGRTQSKLTVPMERGRVGSKRRRVCFVTDFYREDLLAGIAEFARESGWELNAEMRFHGGLPCLDLPFDGILATVVRSIDNKLLDWLGDKQWCAVVRMLNPCVELPYPAVVPDCMGAGQVGARHLLELGHSHCAFYALHPLRETQEILNGFMAELKSAGRSVRLIDLAAAHPDRRVFAVSHEERCDWLAYELGHLPKPLAVMTDNDRRSLELLDACKRIGLRVPEDVAVLGCGNDWLEQLLSPLPLSSVDMNIRAVGVQAAALLDRLMAGETAPVAQVIKVPPLGVVARQSTATVVTNSPAVTAVMRHLREHFRKQVRVADLARLAGMSEQALRLEFKRQAGHSVREELMRLRLACAKRFLQDTDLKLQAIARESGFYSARHLCKVFSGAFRQTPKKWRQTAKSLN